MGEVLAAIEGTDLAVTLRGARWTYAALNALHIAGVALLFGAAVPLSLRLLGMWPRISSETVARLLVPVAASGLALALATGAALFSVRAREYAGNGFLQIKLLLVVVGVLSALAAHASYGLWLRAVSGRRIKAHAAVSIGCWSGALLSGRLIAFVDT